jgi:hypothetical protein
MDAMRFGEQDYIPCELCARGHGDSPGHSRAVDVHHILLRGMGGSKMRDYLANLIALCRPCHAKCHGPEGDKWSEVCQDVVSLRQYGLLHRGVLKMAGKKAVPAEAP